MSALTDLPLFAQAEANPEIEARDRALAQVEKHRGGWLERLRMAARQIAETRHDRTVTSDEVREVFEAMDPPEELSRNLLGAVWRKSEWKLVGRIRSSVKNSHGNLVGVWRLIR